MKAVQGAKGIRGQLSERTAFDTDKIPIMFSARHLTGHEPVDANRPSGPIQPYKGLTKDEMNRIMADTGHFVTDDLDLLSQVLASPNRQLPLPYPVRGRTSGGH